MFHYSAADQGSTVGDPATSRVIYPSVTEDFTLPSKTQDPLPAAMIGGPIPNLLPVATGAAIGGTFRYLLSSYPPPTRHCALLRVGLINITGSFLLGASGAFQKRGMISKRIGAGFGTGFCGGFTTFSTFSVQVMDEMAGIGGVYMGATCMLGVLAAMLGRAVGSRWRI